MKDCIGQEINAGDNIVVQKIGYKELKKEKVYSLSPKRVQIYDKANPGNVRNIEPERVYKIPNIGYLREDNEGNKYVIPEDKIDQFEQYLGSMEGLDYNSLTEPFNIFNMFEEQFGECRVEGDLYDMKIIME